MQLTIPFGDVKVETPGARAEQNPSPFMMSQLCSMVPHTCYTEVHLTGKEDWSLQISGNGAKPVFYEIHIKLHLIPTSHW